VARIGVRNSLVVWLRASIEYVVRESVIVGGSGSRILATCAGESGSLWSNWSEGVLSQAEYVSVLRVFGRFEKTSSARY
jgi:hypothetical protein